MEGEGEQSFNFSIVLVTIIIIIIIVLIILMITFAFIFREAIVGVFIGGAGGIEIFKESVVYDGHSLNLTVKRIKEEGNLVGLRFLIENKAGESYIYEEEVTLDFEESKFFSILTEGFIEDVTKVSVYSMFRGQTGNEEIGEEDVYNLNPQQQAGIMSGGGVCSFIWFGMILWFLGKSFDIDSSIYFMQQYDAERVKIVGETPQWLDNLLIAEKDFGAGILEEDIYRIGINDYLEYWENFDTIVYVEDDYELGLMASTYASLLNAPLIIEGFNSGVFAFSSEENFINPNSNL
jgi:hypothetical protein